MYNGSYKGNGAIMTSIKLVRISSLALMLAVFCGFLGVIDTSAVTYQDNVDVSFTFNPTISINLSSDTASTDLIINNLTPGSVADSNILTVSVTTNATYGYYLTATAGTSSTNTDLVNTENSNYKFTSIATNASLASLSTDNTWGYRISDDNGSTWSNYSGLPKDNDDEGATGKALIETTSPVDNQSIKFKIGAKASTSQAAGTYTNIITFYAVTSPETEDGPTPPETCSTKVPGVKYMQDINSSNKASVLASLTEEAPYYLRDSRDEEPYCVSKLKDGNLWLLDNLRLDLTDSTVLNNTTASNTNASTTSLGYLKNGGGTTSDQYPTAPLNNETWSSNSQNFYSVPMTISTYKDQTTTSYGNGSGKIGIYYNYCAASAGSYCYGNGKSEGTSSGNATEDLCPAGWRMPTGDSSGEYNSLYGYYNTTQTATNTASLQYNLSTPLSGLFGSGSAYNQGTGGNFWSSTRRSDGIMYDLSVYSSSVNPTYGYGRYYGLSMRCLLDS